MSIITDESRATVGKFFQARLTQKVGGVLYGPDSSLWPARWFDTVALLQSELDEESGAFEKAKAEYLSRPR